MRVLLEGGDESPRHGSRGFTSDRCVGSVIKQKKGKKRVSHSVSLIWNCLVGQGDLGRKKTVDSRCLCIFGTRPHDDISRRSFGPERFLLGRVSTSGLFE